MSFNQEQVRKFYQDPHLAKINEMSRKLAKLESDNIEIKTDDIVGRGDSDRTKIRFDDRNTHLKKYDLSDDLPIIPNEPDYDKLKLHLKFWSMGATLHDYSGFNNHANIQGTPCPTLGIDQGLFAGSHHSIAHRNNASEEINYEVPNNSSIQTTGITTGVSYVVFCNFKSLPTTKSTLFEKFDDSSNQVRCCMEGDGQIKLIVKRAGTSYKWRTNAGGVTTNTDYILVFTYTVADNSIHIYRNGTDLSLVVSSEPFTTTTDTNLNIGSDPNDSQYCDFNFIQDFRMYKEKVLTADTHGTSVLMDGVNDNMNLGDHTDLWSQALSKFSVSFWVYPTVMQDGINRMLFRHGNTGHGFEANIDDFTAGECYFHCRNSASSVFTARSTGLVLNQWNNVICVYDSTLGSQNVKIYVNGTLGGTTGNLTEILNSSNTMEFGGPSNDIQGYLKDFRWWTTTALSQAQVTLVMNDSLAAPIPDYWLKLNEGTGTPTDFIKGKTATLGGGTWVSDQVGSLNANKLTISNIPFGRVAISDACVVAQHTGDASYTVESFIDTSYHT